MSEAATADVAIVGAGPIGLELAIALQPTGLRVLHFDAGQIGHTISWFAPQTQFFSSSDRIAIAGVPLQTVNQGKATREEYLAYLRGVVELFDLRVNTFERVIGIEPRDGQFHITTQPSGGKRQYLVNKIILATGGTERPRLLGIPGESLPHVSHYFTDPHLYFRRKLLIVGGKNSAVETAIRCHRAGANVSLNYRGGQLDEARIKYWLMPEMKWLLETGAIKGYFNAVPTEIRADHVVLQSNRISPSPGTPGEGRGEGSGEIRRKSSDANQPSPYPSSGVPGEGTMDVEADFVLLLTGYVADMTLFKLAGVNLKGDAQIPEFNPRTMETNVPGIYAAGTAVAGTQDRYKIFLENCHVHVDRIVAALTARALPPEAEPSHAIPES